MNIALLSPNKNSYSETFIQLQKDGLKKSHTVFYYYDGFIPTRIEGKSGRIVNGFDRLKKQLRLVSHPKLTALKTSLKRNKVDVVLAQYGPTGEAVAEMCYENRIPLVVHFHGYDASINTVIQRHNKYRNIIAYAQRIIAVSKTMVNDLIHIGFDKDKIDYNPCAPHDDFYNLSPQFKIPQFFALGRFTDKKAPYYTILAFSKVLLHFPDAKLVIAGDGPLLDTCINLVRYLKIDNSVSFEGIINKAEVLAIMNVSIAYVQHSITAGNGDKEGTPVAVMEASLAGLPVISTYHAGIPDVIEHEVTGLLSEEHDVETMSMHMKKVLSNSVQTKKMGNNGKFRTHKNLNMKVHLERLETILERSINS